jgi:hypothetical protein
MSVKLGKASIETHDNLWRRYHVKTHTGKRFSTFKVCHFGARLTALWMAVHKNTG